MRQLMSFEHRLQFLTAGGTADVLPHIVSQKLSEKWG
jgi:hypothetical protein